MTFLAGMQALARPIIDYALPPRCPACGVIVSDSLAFCADCWGSIDFIGDPLCATCGLELPYAMIGDAVRCGGCLAEAPPFDRARAVMRYGEVGKTIAHRLKYSRRVSLARVMAAHMARLIDVGEGPGEAAGEGAAILVPVPLHRWRIWSRGFNQAALIAGHMAKRSGAPMRTDLIRRTVNTPPLHSLGPRARRKAVRGAFALSPGARDAIQGKTIILIDDIWTTGSTASACAKLLKAGGAARVEILCWSRVGVAGD